MRTQRTRTPHADTTKPEEATPLTRKLNRRDFVRHAGLGMAAMANVVLTETKTAQASSAEPDADAVGVLIDLTRCTGCNSCALACKVANRKPNPEVAPTELSNDALTYVAVEKDAQGERRFVKRQCMHCLHPACVSACTVGALRKTIEGPIVYDTYKCIGCRYCQYACPFGVPTYDWNNPLGLIHKCQMCFQQRVATGKPPACVTACPSGALRFGKRRELLAQAHAEIATHPQDYVDHVYGEQEAGGTSVLYLSAAPFEQLGFAQPGSSPIPQTAEAVMALTPVVALSVATLATGMHLILRRRQHRDNVAPVTWPETKED